MLAEPRRAHPSRNTKPRSKKKDYDRAIADLTKALEVNPESARFYYERAEAYQLKNDAEPALADLAKAIELKAILSPH